MPYVLSWQTGSVLVVMRRAEGGLLALPATFLPDTVVDSGGASTMFRPFDAVRGPFNFNHYRLRHGTVQAQMSRFWSSIA